MLLSEAKIRLQGAYDTLSKVPSSYTEIIENFKLPETFKALGIPLPNKEQFSDLFFHHVKGYSVNEYPVKVLLSDLSTNIEKLNNISQEYPNLSEVGAEDGKFYNVKIRKAEDEVNTALKSLNSEISSTQDPSKLKKLDERLKSLQESKSHLKTMNEQFATNPSSVSPIDIQKYSTRISEFAKEPSLTNFNQDRFAQAAAAPKSSSQNATGTSNSAKEDLIRSSQNTAAAAAAAATPVSKPSTQTPSSSEINRNTNESTSAHDKLKNIIGRAANSVNSFTSSNTRNTPAPVVPSLPIPNVGAQSVPPTPRTEAAKATAAAAASQPGIGVFSADKDQTLLEAMPVSTLVNLYEALNQPLQQYPKNIAPNMSEEEMAGLRHLTDLVNKGDPQAIKIMQELEAGFPQELKTFQNVNNILSNASVSPEERNRYLAQVESLLNKGVSPVTPQEFENETKNLDVLRERLRNRIIKDFEKNDLRKFQDMFTGKQSYFGSRRKEFEKDLVQNLQDKLADLDASLAVQNDQKAYDRALAEKMRMLQGGNQYAGLNAQTANTALNANNQNIARAQALNATSLAERNQELMRQNVRRQMAQDQSNIGLRANEAAMNAGALKRANEFELNKEKHKNFVDATQHKVNNATKMLDALRGFQMNSPMPSNYVPPSFNANLLSAPLPAKVHNTNYNGQFGALSSLLGNLDQRINPQGLHNFKKGGVVKRNLLAAGGVAENIMRQKMAQATAPVQDPYNQFMGNAQGLSNKLMNRSQNPGNPSGAWLRDYGASLMAADPAKTATQQVGESLKSANAAYDKMASQPGEDLISALVVQDAIFNTKKSVDDFKEKQRLNRETMDLKRASMNAMMGGAGSPMEFSHFDAKGKSTPYGREQAKLSRKSYDDARIQASAVNELHPLLESAKGLIPKVHSGHFIAIANQIAGPLGASMLGGGDSKDIAALETIGNSIVSALEKLTPGRAAVARLELLKKSKMGIHLPQETNQKILNELMYMKDMVYNRASFIQSAADIGVQAHEAEHAYNEYVRDIYEGKKDSSPLKYMHKLDPEKKEFLEQIFRPIESFKDKLDNGEFASDVDLNPNSDFIQPSKQDIEEYSSQTGKSKEQSRKELTAALNKKA